MSSTIFCWNVCRYLLRKSTQEIGTNGWKRTTELFHFCSSSHLDVCVEYQQLHRKGKRVQTTNRNIYESHSWEFEFCHSSLTSKLFVTIYSQQSIIWHSTNWHIFQIHFPFQKVKRSFFFTFVLVPQIFKNIPSTEFGDIVAQFVYIIWSGMSYNEYKSWKKKALDCGRVLHMLILQLLNNPKKYLHRNKWWLLNNVPVIRLVCSMLIPLRSSIQFQNPICMATQTTWIKHILIHKSLSQ